jgi:hypothetical protein
MNQALYAHMNNKRKMKKKKEQDSNPGRWRKGRFIMLAGQHSGSVHKWHQP